MQLFQKLSLLCLLLVLSSSMAFSADKYDLIVAQDGSGNFKTVQEAINAVPDFRKKTTTIFIKKGIYKEKLVLAGSKQLVRLIGEDVDKTILTYDDWAQKKNAFGEEKGTSGSSSFYIYGDGFSAECKVAQWTVCDPLGCDCDGVNSNLRPVAFS